MAVFPKRYSKRGPIVLEDYVIYMIERIEQDSRIKDQRIAELKKICEEQAEKIAELKKICEEQAEKIAELEKITGQES